MNSYLYASDIKTLKDFLKSNNLSIKDFVEYRNTSIPSYYNQPLKWYLTQQNQIISLRISGTKLENIKNLGELKNIRELDLSQNKLLKRLDLRELDKLEILNLRACGIQDLKLPKSLKELDISGNNLGRIDLKEFDKLEKLNMSYCGIDNYNGNALKLPESLIELDLSWNPLLKRVNLSQLDKLEKLNLSRCEITEYTSLELPKSLKKLDISENESLGFDKLENVNFDRDSIEKKIDNIDKFSIITGMDIIPNAHWFVVNLFEDKLSSYLSYNFDITKLTTYQGEIVNKEVGLKFGFNVDVDDNLIGKFNKVAGWIGYKKYNIKVQSGKLKGIARWNPSQYCGGWGCYDLSWLPQETRFDNNFTNINLFWHPKEGMETTYYGFRYTSYSLPMAFSIGDDSAYDPNSKIKIYSLVLGDDTVLRTLWDAGKRKEGFEFMGYIQTGVGIGKIKLSPVGIKAAKAIGGSESKALVGFVDYDISIGLQYYKRIRELPCVFAVGYNIYGSMIANNSEPSEPGARDYYNCYYFLNRGGPIFRVHMLW